MNCVICLSRNGEVTIACPRSGETQSQDLKPWQPDYEARVLNHLLTLDRRPSTVWRFEKTHVATEGAAAESGVGCQMAPLGEWSLQSEGSRVGPQDRRRAQTG